MNLRGGSGSGSGSGSRASVTSSLIVEDGLPVVLSGHTDRVTNMTLRSTGVIETASLDGTVRVWMKNEKDGKARVPSGEVKRGLIQGCHSGSIHSIGDSSDSDSDSESESDDVDSSNDDDDGHAIFVPSPRPKIESKSIIKSQSPDDNKFVCAVIMRIFDTESVEASGISLFSTSTLTIPHKTNRNVVGVTGGKGLKKVFLKNNGNNYKNNDYIDNSNENCNNNYIDTQKIKREIDEININEGDYEEKEKEQENEIENETQNANKNANKNEIKNVNKNGREKMHISTFSDAGADGQGPGSGIREKVGGVRTWLVAVSIGGIVKAYATPTFAPITLSDTQTF